MFLDISHTSQENTSARVSFLIRLQAFRSFLQNTSGRLLLKNHGFFVKAFLLMKSFFQRKSVRYTRSHMNCYRYTFLLDTCFQQQIASFRRKHVFQKKESCERLLCNSGFKKNFNFVPSMLTFYFFLPSYCDIFISRGYQEQHEIPLLLIYLIFMWCEKIFVNWD